MFCEKSYIIHSWAYDLYWSNWLINVEVALERQHTHTKKERIDNPREWGARRRIFCHLNLHRRPPFFLLAEKKTSTTTKKNILSLEAEFLEPPHYCTRNLNLFCFFSPLHFFINSYVVFLTFLAFYQYFKGHLSDELYKSHNKYLLPKIWVASIRVPQIVRKKSRCCKVAGVETCFGNISWELWSFSINFSIKCLWM